MTDEEVRYQKRNQTLMIHLGVYLISNIILFIINYMIDYSYAWHMWSLVPWGAAMLIHVATVISINVIERSLELRLAIHGSITMILSTYFLWNDWFANGEIEWILFVVVPLVLIWLNHLVVYRIMKPKYHKVTGDVIEPSIFIRMIDKQSDILAGENISGDKRKAARKIVINKIILRNHIIIYAAVNIFLFFMNWQRDWAFTEAFLWSTLSWGLTIFLHTFSYLQMKKKTFGQRITKKLLFSYPLTISVFLLFTDILPDRDFNWFWWAVVPLILVSLVIIQIVGRSELKKTVRKGRHLKVKTVSSSRNDVHMQRVQKASKRFCPKCGNQIMSHHKFCQSCGYEIN